MADGGWWMVDGIALASLESRAGTYLPVEHVLVVGYSTILIE